MLKGLCYQIVLLATPLPTCNPASTATQSGTVYREVTASAVSQHGLPILGQEVTGYVDSCDRVQ